jgi:hypothetical protein
MAVCQSTISLILELKSSEKKPHSLWLWISYSCVIEVISSISHVYIFIQCGVTIGAVSEHVILLLYTFWEYSDRWSLSFRSRVLWNSSLMHVRFQLLMAVSVKITTVFSDVVHSVIETEYIFTRLHDATAKKTVVFSLCCSCCCHLDYCQL